MSSTYFAVAAMLILASPAWVVAEDGDPPRVLIIGDSIYRQPAQEAVKQLQGKVLITYASVPPGEVCSTASVLEHLELILGGGEWDVVHVNCGLGDLAYRAPGVKSFRVLPPQAGGVRSTPPEEYEQNLRELVKQLRATGATLIWASTTPIRHSSTNIFQPGSEREYNAIAAKVMSEHRIAVNDMYKYVVDRIDMNRPAAHGADPFFFDREPLHPPLIKSILSELEFP